MTRRDNLPGICTADVYGHLLGYSQMLQVWEVRIATWHGNVCLHPHETSCASDVVVKHTLYADARSSEMREGIRLSSRGPHRK